MKHFVYTLKGNLWIVTPPQVKDRSRPELSDEEYLAFIRHRVIPDGAVGVRVVDTSELPKDRTYRDAWKDNGKGIDVDEVRRAEIERRK